MNDAVEVVFGKRSEQLVTVRGVAETDKVEKYYLRNDIAGDAHFHQGVLEQTPDVIFIDHFLL